MTPGTSTLRDVLEQHVTSVPERPTRLAEVHRRASSLRRRRAGGAVGAVAALVVVVLAVTSGPGLLTSRQDRGVPAHRQHVGALLVWTNGSRLAAHGTFVSEDRRSSTLTFTPTTWSFGFSQACSRDLGQHLGVYWSVNGHTYGGGSCSPGGGGGVYSRGAFGIEQKAWSDAGVRLGHQVTVRFWVARVGTEPTGDGGPATYTGPLPRTRVTFGVYQRVDPSAYPLPPRPRHLLDLDAGFTQEMGPVVAEVDSRKTGSNGTTTLTEVVPQGGLHVFAQFVAPGQVLVSVDGVAIDRLEAWGWTGAAAEGQSIDHADLTPYGLDLRAGQTVTVTVTASRFTAPGWRLWLARPAPGSAAGNPGGNAG